MKFKELLKSPILKIIANILIFILFLCNLILNIRILKSNNEIQDDIWYLRNDVSSIESDINDIDDNLKSIENDVDRLEYYLY